MITKTLPDFPAHEAFKPLASVLKNYAAKLDDHGFAKICRENARRFREDFAWFEKHLGHKRLSKEAQDKIQRFHDAKLDAADLLAAAGWFDEAHNRLLGEPPRNL